MEQGLPAAPVRAGAVVQPANHNRVPMINKMKAFLNIDLPPINLAPKLDIIPGFARIKGMPRSPGSLASFRHNTMLCFQKTWEGDRQRA